MLWFHEKKNLVYNFVHFYHLYIWLYISQATLPCFYLQKLYETSPSAHYYTLILFDNFTTSSPKEIKIKGIILYCVSLIILYDKYSFDGMTLIRVSDATANWQFCYIVFYYNFQGMYKDRVEREWQMKFFWNSHSLILQMRKFSMKEIFKEYILNL